MPRTSPEAVDAFVEDVRKKGIDLTTYRGLTELYRFAEQWRDQAMRMWTGKNAPTPEDAYERCHEFVINPAVGNVLNEDVTARMISWIRATFEELEDRLHDVKDTIKLVRQVLRRVEWRISYYRRQLRRAREQYERTKHWYYEVETRYYERIIRELEEQARNIRSALREYEQTVRRIEELVKMRDIVMKIVENYHGVYDMINGEVLERASRYGKDIASARAAVVRAVTDLVQRGYITWSELYTLAWIGYYLGKVEWYYDILRTAALQVKPEEVQKLRPLEEIESFAQLLETAPTTSIPREQAGTIILPPPRQSQTQVQISGLVKRIRLRESAKLLEEDKIVNFHKEKICDEKGKVIAERYRVLRARHRYIIRGWHKLGSLLVDDLLPLLVNEYIIKKQNREEIVSKIAEALSLSTDTFRNMLELVYGNLSIPIEVVYIKLKSGRVDTLIKVGLRNAPQLYIYSKYRKSVMKAETWETCSEYETTITKLPLPSLGITLWFPAGNYIVHDIYSEAKLGRVWFTWAIDADGKKRIIDELKRQSILVVKTAGGYFYFLDVLSKSPNKILKIAHKLEKTYGDIGHKRAAYVRQRAGSQAWGVIRVGGKYGTLGASKLEIVYERKSQYGDLEEWKERVIRLITGEYYAKSPDTYIRDMCMRLTTKLTPELALVTKLPGVELVRRMVGYAMKMIEQLDDKHLVKILELVQGNT